MASPLSIICCFRLFAKEPLTGPVQCPGCGDRHRHVKHGTYTRYFPDRDEEVRVQRYRCRNPACSRVTFSILPFPCLRYKRHTLSTFGEVVRQAARCSVNELARLYKKGWSAMRRMIRASLQVWSCFESERDRHTWGPCPCKEPVKYWTSFTQTLSYATLPGPG